MAVTYREAYKMFVSCGIAGLPSQTPYACELVEFFRCLSRYPTPAACARSSYGPIGRYGAYHNGWSDHCVGLEGCYTALMCGATIIEKHVQLPNQARPPKPFEATMDELKQLRAFADEDPQRFIGRWQHA